MQGETQQRRFRHAVSHVGGVHGPRPRPRAHCRTAAARELRNPRLASTLQAMLAGTLQAHCMELCRAHARVP